MEVPVGVSRRHVHLTKATFYELFNTLDLPIRNELNQPGEYASTLTVDLEWNGNIIEHVRIVGPFRSYNQIEVSDTECEILKVNPPSRQSGDIIGPNGKISLNKGLIKAERHIHMTKETLEKENLQNKEKVAVFHKGKFLFDATIKLSNPGFNELHIDTVEENEFNLHSNDIVEFKKYLR